MRSPILTACLTLLSATVATAQSWTVNGGVLPSAINGIMQMASDSSGLVYCDFVSTALFNSATSTWTATPAAVLPILGALIGGGSTVVHFGGMPPAGGSTNNLVRFNRVTGTWVNVPTAGVGPTPRFQAAGAFFTPTNAILVGGTTSTTPLGGFTSFLLTMNTPTTGVWVPLSNGPSARFSATVGSGPNGTAVLFGGRDASGLLGDTWVFTNGAWMLQTGPGPAPAEMCSMAFDSVRGVTVLSHSSSSPRETWEWNGATWRRVLTEPAPQGVGFAQASGAQPARTIGLETNPTTGLADTFVFAPSPAAYTTTLPNTTCFAGAAQPFRLAASAGSLPLLGGNLQLQISQVASSALVIAGVEFASGTTALGGCNCYLGLTMVGTSQIPVVNMSGTGTLSLPLPANLAYRGVTFDIQAFAIDAILPCQFATSDRVTAVVGG